MTTGTKSLVVAATAAACIAAASVPAMAEVVLYASKSSNFSFTTATAMVPLKGNGRTSLSFVFSENPKGMRVITFSAECAVDAPAGSFTGWVDIDILVNGIAVPPTDQTSDAFCSSNGTVGFDGWATQSISVARKLNAGPHTIEVRARLNGGATGGWISDTALVVFD